MTPLGCMAYALTSVAVAAASSRLASGCAWAAPYLPLAGVVALIVIAMGAVLAGGVMLVRWWPSFAHAAIASADGLQQAMKAVRGVAPAMADQLDWDNRKLQLAAGAKTFLEGDRLHAAAKAKRETAQEVSNG